MGNPTYAEEVIKKRRELNSTEQEDYYHVENNIEKGYIIIKYEKLELEEKELLEGSITMCMPKEFQPMEEEIIAVKYPDPDRPKWIYTNEDTTVNFTFQIEEGEVKEEEIKEIRDLLAQQMKRLYPSSPIEEAECFNENGHVMECFSFLSPLIDGELYNYLYFMAVKEGLLMGGFSCSEFEKKQWEPVIKQMVGTLKEVEEKKE